MFISSSYHDTIYSTCEKCLHPFQQPHVICSPYESRPCMISPGGTAFETPSDHFTMTPLYVYPASYPQDCPTLVKQLTPSKSPINPRTPDPVSPSLLSSKNNKIRCVTTPSTTASSATSILPKLKPMKLQFFRTKMCPWVIASGKCRKDQHCRYAHCIEDLRPLPDLTKTKMCTSLVQTGQCSNPKACKYAHTPDELRATRSFSKTKLCPSWLEGSCASGQACRFAHGEDEMRIHSLVSKDSSDQMMQISTPRPSHNPAFGSETRAVSPTIRTPRCMAKTDAPQARGSWSLGYPDQVSSPISAKEPFPTLYQQGQHIGHYSPDQIITQLLPSGIFTPLTTKRQSAQGQASRSIQPFPVHEDRYMDSQNGAGWRTPTHHRGAKASSYFQQFISPGGRECSSGNTLYNPLCYATPVPVYPTTNTNQYVIPTATSPYPLFDYSKQSNTAEGTQQPYTQISLDLSPKHSTQPAFQWNHEEQSPYLNSLLTVNSFSNDSHPSKDDDPSDSKPSTMECFQNTPLTQIHFPTTVDDDMDDEQLISTFGSDNHLRLTGDPSF